MDRADDEAIRNKFGYLVDNIRVQDIKHHLYSVGILTAEDMEDLGLNTTTDRFKMETLLMTLRKRGPTAFDEFQTALRHDEVTIPVADELLRSAREIRDRLGSELVTMLQRIENGPHDIIKLGTALDIHEDIRSNLQTFLVEGDQLAQAMLRALNNNRKAVAAPFAEECRKHALKVQQLRKDLKLRVKVLDWERNNHQGADREEMLHPISDCLS